MEYHLLSQLDEPLEVLVQAPAVLSLTLLLLVLIPFIPLPSIPLLA